MNRIYLPLLLASALTAHAQGPLTPPGAPSPTMKMLDQIEPRIPITNLPYAITQSGSYYLTGNLISAGHGIVVRADNVTVDLMGFRLTGNRSTPHRGVLVENTDSALPIRNVVIRNGHITDFYTGVWLEKAFDCRVEDIHATSNVLDGVQIRYGRGTVLDTIVMTGNGANGLYLYAFGGTSSYHTVKNSRIMHNAEDGVRAYAGIGGWLAGNRIQKTTISGNAQNGIAFSTDSDGVVLGNHIADVIIAQNGGYGIIASGEYLQFSGNIIARTQVRGHGGAGIRIRGGLTSLSNQFLDMQVQDNGSHGIWIEQRMRGCILAGATIRGNSGNGILLDTSDAVYGTAGWIIRECAITGNDSYGIHTLVDQGTADGLLIEGNTLSGNGAGGLYFRSRNEGDLHGILVRNNAMDGAFPIRFQADGLSKASGGLVIENTLRGGEYGMIMSARDDGVLQGFSIMDNVFSGFEEIGLSFGGQDNGINIGHLVAGNQFSAPGAGLGKGMFTFAAGGGQVEGLWIRENSIAVPHVANIHVSADSARILVTGNQLATNTPIFITGGANVSYGPIAQGSGQMGGGAMSHPWANLVAEEP